MIGMADIKVLVAQELPQDIADKVNKELARREYAQRLSGLLKEITDAGFIVDVEYGSTRLPNRIFTNTISILGKSLKG